MFCTHCGAGDQSEQAYCKRCGKWLGSSAPEQRLIMMLIFSAISAVFGAASAIALFATYLGTKLGTPAVYLAATFCTIISVYQTITFFFTLGLWQRLKRGRSEGQHIRDISTSENVQALEDGDTTEFVSMPSVTESTTELLDPARRVAKRGRFE